MPLKIMEISQLYVEKSKVRLNEIIAYMTVIVVVKNSFEK